jgi:D-arabinose 1-dehydrogenase-like Zn-dependent alcohol dehydrogenase
LPIFDAVLGGITVRGSIVGTRLDLAESLMFAAQGKVKAHRARRAAAALASTPRCNVLAFF